MVGKVTSKGDRVMRAQVARRNFHLDGRGIKIGVISDSFNALGGADADVASGDLPGRNNPLGYTKPVRVLKDLKSGNDEGRAMLQIIADIAPGAEQLFHTAYINGNNITEQSFAKAVKALAKAGADIIVDDIGFATTFFQDGFAAQEVSKVVKQGIAYFSAIGNDSNRSYESAFHPSSTFVFRGNTYEAHDFDPSTGIDLFQDVTLSSGSTIQPLLSWDQPVGKITSDLELFLVSNLELPNEAETNVLAVSSTLFAGGVEQPLEQLAYDTGVAKTAYFVIARKIDPANTTNHIKWISTANDADSNVVYQYVNDGSSTGASTIYGQPNAKGAVAVGAVQVNKTPLFGVKPPVLDDFSSQGGTSILFDSQGNRLNIPEIRQKPEIVAPNGVSTTFEPFKRFFGTSAAAPHAAAVAALLLQRAGGAKRLSPDQLVQIMQRSAIAIDPPGNFRSGAGLIQADTAVLEAYSNRVQGTQSRERIQGKPGADNITGLGGNDRLNGGKGFDALFGGNQRDTLRGDQGNDYLLGEAGNDVLVGGQGGDVLLGGQGRDYLIGGKSDDLLAGGAGKNLLSGDEGQNTFVLFRDGVAVVQDFQQQDQIGLADGLRFNQIQQLQQGQDLILKWRGQTLARLVGIAEPLAAADFTSIAIQG